MRKGQGMPKKQMERKESTVPGVLALEMSVVDTAKHELAPTCSCHISVQPKAEDRVLEEVLLNGIIDRGHGTCDGDVWEAQTLRHCNYLSQFNVLLGQGVARASCRRDMDQMAEGSRGG